MNSGGGEPRAARCPLGTLAGMGRCARAASLKSAYPRNAALTSASGRPSPNSSRGFPNPASGNGSTGYGNVSGGPRSEAGGPRDAFPWCRWLGERRAGSVRKVGAVGATAPHREAYRRPDGYVAGGGGADWRRVKPWNNPSSRAMRSSRSATSRWTPASLRCNPAISRRMAWRLERITAASAMVVPMVAMSSGDMVVSQKVVSASVVRWCYRPAAARSWKRQ